MAKTVLPQCGAEITEGMAHKACRSTDRGVHVCVLVPHAEGDVVGYPSPGSHACACGFAWFDERELRASPDRIAVVELRPGDIVVVEVDEALSDTEFERTCTRLERGLPAGVRAMVVDKARVSGVLRTEQSWRAAVGESTGKVDGND